MRIFLVIRLADVRITIPPRVACHRRRRLIKILCVTRYYYYNSRTYIRTDR